MKKRIHFGGLIGVVVALASVMVVGAFSSGPSNKRTGAPGETTCAVPECHGEGNNLNTGQDGFRVLVEGNPDGFLPGQTYTIVVSFETPTGADNPHGFELVALDSSGNSRGSFTTSPNITQTSEEQFAEGITRTYLKHAQGGANQTEWTTEWTAPNDSVDTITFYASGLAGNGADGASGDSAYTDSLHFSRSSTMSLQPNLAANIASFKAYPNPVDEHITVEYTLKNPENASLTLTSLTGQRLIQRSLPKRGQGTHNIRLAVPADLSPGHFFLTLKVGNHKSTQILQKK